MRKLKICISFENLENELCVMSSVYDLLEVAYIYKLKPKTNFNCKFSLLLCMFFPVVQSGLPHGFPSLSEPSDHMMLAASLYVKHNQV